MDKVSLAYLTDRETLVQSIEFNVRGIKKSYRQLHHPVSLKLGNINNKLQLVGIELYVEDGNDMNDCVHTIVNFIKDFIKKNILNEGNDFESAMLRLGYQSIVNDAITMIRQFIIIRLGFADNDVIFDYIEPILEVLSDDEVIINTDAMLLEV